MIKNTIKAITSVLKNNFSDTEVYSTDIDAGFKTPCFFIKINSVESSKLTEKIDELSINIDVLYACKDEKNNQIECFEVLEKMRNVFLKDYINITEDISFFPLEHSAEIGDDYVSLTLDIYMQLIKIEDENLEYVEDITIF